MKTVIYLTPAQKALRKHRNMAERIMSKLDQYVADPASLGNMVTEMRGTSGKRLRVGTFRVLFEETETEIVVTVIAPRGGVYD